LGATWQQWAWEWEKLLEQEGHDISPFLREEFFFAKTDFNHSKVQYALQNTMKLKRPNHACESVMIGMELIADSLGVDSPDSNLLPLLRAVCGAIARHHTPQGHEYGDVVLTKDAKGAIKDALEDVRRDASWQYDLSLLETGSIQKGNLAPENADAYVTVPKLGRSHELETWLYFVIVRALRLADQRAGVRW
jgi:CRISPR-associated endonuclease/helicase Cas3